MYVNIYNLCDVGNNFTQYNLFYLDEHCYIKIMIVRLNLNYTSSNSASNISSNIQNTLLRSFITKSHLYDFFNSAGSSIRWDGILLMTCQCLPWKSNLYNYFTLIFKIINFKATEDLSLKYRLTLDYKEDLVVIKRILTIFILA